MAVSIFYSLLSIWLVRSSANVLPAPPESMVTPAPAAELLKKQNDNRFMGYLSYLGGYTSEDCDVGGTFYQHGGYAGCCSTTAAVCNFPIGCVSGSLIYTYATGTVTAGTYACSALYTEPSEVSQTICATAFIFENTDDSNPNTEIFCGVTAANWSYYRVKPTLTTPSVSSATATTNPSTTAPISSPTSTSTPTQTSAPAPSKSKAWIAGVVIGPIALIAVAGLVAYIFFLKKKQRQNAPQNPPAQLSPPQYPQYGPGPQGGAAIGQPLMVQPAYSPSMSPAPQNIPNSPAGVQQQWQGQGQQQGWVGAEPKQNVEVGAEQVPSPRLFSAELDGRHIQQQALR